VRAGRGAEPGARFLTPGLLADCGYVVARREGRHTYYRVTDPRVAELVEWARSLAADNTAALAECARIDIDDRPNP